MTTSLAELLAEQAKLEQKISEVRAAQKSDAIKKVRELIEQNSLTKEDIFHSTSSAKPRKTTTAKVAAKYRDPVSGKQWSGRGLAPKWLAGQDRSKFLIS